MTEDEINALKVEAYNLIRERGQLLGEAENKAKRIVEIERMVIEHEIHEPAKESIT